MYAHGGPAAGEKSGATGPGASGETGDVLPAAGVSVRPAPEGDG